MKESGVLSNIWSKYKLQKAENCLGTGITALGLENLMGIFLFLACAMGLVSVIFMAEQFGK